MKFAKIIYHCSDKELNLRIIQVSINGKLSVMRILFISLFFLLFMANHAQNENLKLVYNQSSEEAKNEIRSFLNSNPNYFPTYKKLEKRNYIYLSSEQFNQINDYVENYKNIDSDKYAEFLEFKTTWFSRYKSTNQLINELKD